MIPDFAKNGHRSRLIADFQADRNHEIKQQTRGKDRAQSQIPWTNNGTEKLQKL